MHLNTPVWIFFIGFILIFLTISTLVKSQTHLFQNHDKAPKHTQETLLDIYDSLGVLHNSIIENLEVNNVLYNTKVTEWDVAFALSTNLYGNKNVAVSQWQKTFTAYNRLPKNLFYNRGYVYNTLHLDERARSYLEKLFTLPDSCSYTTSRNFIADIRKKIKDEHQWDLRQKSTVQMVLAIAYHSNHYWHKKESMQKVPITGPDSLQRIRHHNLMLVDGFGVLKGLMAGLFTFGFTGVFLQATIPAGIAAGSTFLIFFPIFESARYARRLRLGLLKVTDYPFYPLKYYKNNPPAELPDSISIN